MQQTCLFGTYEHTVDDKGRVTLPAEFREHFARGAVLARLPIQPLCVMVFSEDDWRAYEERYIDSLNTYDNFEDDWDSRFIFARMSRCVPDRQGRVSLVQAKISDGQSRHPWEPESFGDMEPGNPQCGDGEVPAAEGEERCREGEGP